MRPELTGSRQQHRRHSLRPLPFLLATLLVAPPLLTCGSDGGSSSQPPALATAGSGGGTAAAGGHPGGHAGSAGGPSDAGPAPGPEMPGGGCAPGPLMPLTAAQTGGGEPAIIWTGSGYLALWSSGSAVPGRIYAARLNPDGTRPAGSQDVVVAETPNRASSPELVAVPGATPSYAVVFEDCASCPAGAAVMSVILGADAVAKAPPVMLSPPAAVQRRPYVAAGLGNVYATFRDLLPAEGGKPARAVARAVKLGPTGARLDDGSGIVLPAEGSGQYPNLAVSPDRLALVYERKNPQSDIVLALLDAGLTQQKEAIVRSGETVRNDSSNPVVQWNGSQWVVAWEDLRDDEDRIYVSVVDADGSRIGEAQNAYGGSGNWPAIAAGKSMTSAIAFYGYPGEQIMVARTGADGGLKPGPVVLSKRGKYPAISYDSVGDGYGVIYEDLAEQRIVFARLKCRD